MRTEPIDDALLLNYLLGNLSEEEQARVEDRALADADYLGALEAAEADLIDGYVRGELSQSDRREFERRFLTSPQRLSKVEFAKAFKRVAADLRVSQAPPSAWQTLVNLFRSWNPVLQFASAAAALILVAAASWLMVQNGEMRSRVNTLEAQRRSLQQQLNEEHARNAQLQKQPPPEAAHTPLLASLVFLPGLSRGNVAAQRLVLNPSAQLVHIEIELEPRDDFPQFRAELHTRSGEEILIRSNLQKRRTSAGAAVVFDVPSSALPAGEYEMALKGISNGQATDIGFYYFTVQK